MALYARQCSQIALELAAHDPVYEHVGGEVLRAFRVDRPALGRMGDRQDDLWDEEDGFFYDVLRLPDGSAQRLKVRSIVGLMPLCAATVLEPAEIRPNTQCYRAGQCLSRELPPTWPSISRYQPSRPPMAAGCWQCSTRRRLRRCLQRMLDEADSSSPFGIRSLSRFHHDHPYRFQVGERAYWVGIPTGRIGPRHLRRQLELARSGMDADQLSSSCAHCTTCTATMARLQGRMPDRFRPAATLLEIAEEIARRLFAIFQRGPDGRRPLYGGTETFHTDPHWRDLILFYEYFHGDNGAGIGASHQTGWTGGISLLSMLTGSAAAMAQAFDGDRNQYLAGFALSHRPK